MGRKMALTIDLFDPWSPNRQLERRGQGNELGLAVATRLGEYLQ
jgi:hypothetical protein